MDGIVLNMVVLVLLAATGVALMVRSYQRSPSEVLLDLAEEGGQELSVPLDGQGRGSARRLEANDFTRAGLLTREARRRFEIGTKLFPLGVAAALVVLNIASGGRNPALVVVCVVLGLSLGYLVAQSRLRRHTAAFQREIEFFLPVVMERLVMAVQAGLDILPSVQMVTQPERDRLGAPQPLDPVSRLLRLAYQMTESGLGFRRALDEVARLVESAPLRHAFIHMGLAQEQGGEVVTPLRELSDSTQLYYQESVEEEIAKLPVRATLPLLCTFTGLLLGFLTPPFIQIVDMLQRMTASMGG